MTPPAIAPTFGPASEFDIGVNVAVDAAEATHSTFWHAVQVGGTNTHVLPCSSQEGFTGHCGVIW